MDGHQPYPHSGKKRKRPWHGPRGPQAQQFRPQQHNPLGPYFGGVPLLEDMRQANKKRTRQHFSQGPRPQQRRRQQRPRNTPKSIPRAPEHDHTTAFPSGANPLDTPAPEIAAFPTAADKLEAEGLNSGLDFYGTNEGMLGMFRHHSPDSASEQSELEGHSGDEEDYGQQHLPGGGCGRMAALAARLAEQDAHIATLEDENLRLRERLDMLQQELNDLRRHGGVGQQEEHADSGSGWGHGSRSEEDHSIAHLMAAEGPARSEEPSPPS